MTILHFILPYRESGDVAKSINAQMKHVRDGEWACIIMHGTTLLTSDAPEIIENYCKSNPKAGLLTCWTNKAATPELQYNVSLSADHDMKRHRGLAINLAGKVKQTQHLRPIVEPYLMCVSKKTWRLFPFTEGLSPQDMAAEYGKKLADFGYSILRMNAVYVYRTIF